ncbi:MAG TPA: hypothetical protein VN446_01625 [Candidatus Acidoferrum sp.]|nr:hypothetical protein [Candidatus Acidoferrum sp.]
MRYTIRPLFDNISDFITDSRRSAGKGTGLLGASSESSEIMSMLFGDMCERNHFFLAHREDQREVVGIAGLSVGSTPRTCYTGRLILIVRQSEYKYGLHRKLLERLLDLADNWLKLVRTEITVTGDSEQYLRFFASYGFQVESVGAKSLYREGYFEDEYHLVRIGGVLSGFPK